MVLTPNTSEHSQFENCKNVIQKVNVIVTSEKKKAQIESSLSTSDFIHPTLKHYYDEQKFKKRTKEITPEMALPIDKLF